MTADLLFSVHTDGHGHVWLVSDDGRRTDLAVHSEAELTNTELGARIADALDELEGEAPHVDGSIHDGCAHEHTSRSFAGAPGTGYVDHCTDCGATLANTIRELQPWEVA